MKFKLQKKIVESINNQNIISRFNLKKKKKNLKKKRNHQGKKKNWKRIEISPLKLDLDEENCQNKIEKL